MTWSSSPVGPSSTSQGSGGGGDGAGSSAGASPASARCRHAGPSRAKASDAGTGSLWPSSPAAPAAASPPRGVPPRRAPASSSPRPRRAASAPPSRLVAACSPAARAAAPPGRCAPPFRPCATASAAARAAAGRLPVGVLIVIGVTLLTLCPFGAGIIVAVGATPLTCLVVRGALSVEVAVCAQAAVGCVASCRPLAGTAGAAAAVELGLYMPFTAVNTTLYMYMYQRSKCNGANAKPTISGESLPDRYLCHQRTSC